MLILYYLSLPTPYRNFTVVRLELESLGSETTSMQKIGVSRSFQHQNSILQNILFSIDLI